MPMLEMWGGLECTLNRVGDRYIDQCEKSGHYLRPGDIKLFADLGIKKIRYPCLWERAAPKDLDHFDWKFLDERLEEIRRLGLDPIAGFLHHGSGPRYTSLIDPDFPEKFAVYARNFSRRYPWIEHFTPINEIVTTARFSCLYGHWYPHLKDDLYFYKAVLYQCRATVLAMREIRAVNPKAKLIQTDDLGRCQSTPPLEYQRDFENERRWLGFDLLCGRLDEEGIMYQQMIRAGIREEEVQWLKDNTCPPDVIGINHYHLSSRFLDHRLELYPEAYHGGNGQHCYADVGAVDCGQCEPPLPESLMLEACGRYSLPIAVTEVHTRGNREAQMRWLHQMWRAAEKIRAEGADVRAVTAWSLLGTYDWNNLCTKCGLFYEPGVFDLRNPFREPRPTALTRLVNELAEQGESSSQLLLSEGPWRTARRIHWAMKHGEYSALDFLEQGPPVLIVGATGTLGRSMARICGTRNIPFRLLGRQQMDICIEADVEAALDKYRPWAVINAAGYVKVDEAEGDQERCFRENLHGPALLARTCAKRGIKFATYSSDLVFDGSSSSPYLESHGSAPINVYGKSKALCELEVMRECPSALVIRTSSFFGPWDQYNFVTQTLRALLKGEEVHLPDDMIVSPTYVPDLAHETLNLLIDGESGVVHLANQGAVSWAEFAHLTVAHSRRHHINSSLIKTRKSSELSFRARRPQYSALSSERNRYLPPLVDALERYHFELETPLGTAKEGRA